MKANKKTRERRRERGVKYRPLEQGGTVPHSVHAYLFTRSHLFKIVTISEPPLSRYQIASLRIVMENGTSSAGDPSGFLSEIIGAPVTVKLNSGGVVFKGVHPFYLSL